MHYSQIRKAADYIRKKADHIPDTGIILGTGLQAVKEEIQIDVSIEYNKIPGFPVPTVVSHESSVIIGKLKGKSVLILTGRVHYYEGWMMQEVAFAVAVLGYLKIKKLIISNITGSVNPMHKLGDLVMIKDHINLQSSNPLRPVRTPMEGFYRSLGKYDSRLGPRFPSMINAYDADWRKQIINIADHLGISLHEGVYTAMDGPSLETPAEYRMIHLLGGDVVGMSTVPEVIVARQKGIKVCVLSIVSNVCYPIEDIKEDTIDTILANVEIGVPSLKKLIYAILQASS